MSPGSMSAYDSMSRQSLGIPSRWPRSHMYNAAPHVSAQHVSSHGSGSCFRRCTYRSLSKADGCSHLIVTDVPQHPSLSPQYGNTTPQGLRAATAQITHWRVIGSAHHLCVSLHQQTDHCPLLQKLCSFGGRAQWQGC